VRDACFALISDPGATALVVVVHLHQARTCDDEAYKCLHYTTEIQGKRIPEGYKILAICENGYTYVFMYTSWADSLPDLTVPTATPLSLSIKTRVRVPANKDPSSSFVALCLLGNIVGDGSGVTICRFTTATATYARHHHLRIVR
jgi:hypothetical protein